MGLIWLEFMIVLNDFIEQRCKYLIGILTASVNSYGRIWVLTPRENSLLEREAS